MRQTVDEKLQTTLETRLDQLVRRHGDLRTALSGAGLSGPDFARLSKEYSELTPIVLGEQEVPHGHHDNFPA